MKHLNDYKIFENRIGNFFRDSKIKSICEQYDINNYTINSDGSIDVDNNVNLYNRGLVGLPLKFNRVSGRFVCGSNILTSLEGSPKYVGGSFYCSSNQITSLEGCPEYVGGTFHCENNPIYSIVRWFINRDDKNDLIELFNYYDIVQGTNIVYDRLKYFYETINEELFHIMLLHMQNSGYKIIK